MMPPHTGQPLLVGVLVLVSGRLFSVEETGLGSGFDEPGAHHGLGWGGAAPRREGAGVSAPDGLGSSLGATVCPGVLSDVGTLPAVVSAQSWRCARAKGREQQGDRS